MDMKKLKEFCGFETGFGSVFKVFKDNPHWSLLLFGFMLVYYTFSIMVELGRAEQNELACNIYDYVMTVSRHFGFPVLNVMFSVVFFSIFIYGLIKYDGFK